MANEIIFLFVLFGVLIFLGKKLGPYEMAMSTAALLIPMGMVLIFTAIAISTKTGLSSLNNTGTHGLSEILYAYTSACGNNGSAFAGLNANTPFYNLSTGFCMLIGRFVTIIPALAIAGSLAAKKNVPVTEMTPPPPIPEAERGVSPFPLREGGRGLGRKRISDYGNNMAAETVERIGKRVFCQAQSCGTMAQSGDVHC